MDLREHFEECRSTRREFRIFSSISYHFKTNYKIYRAYIHDIFYFFFMDGAFKNLVEQNRRRN